MGQIPRSIERISSLYTQLPVHPAT